MSLLNWKCFVALAALAASVVPALAQTPAQVRVSRVVLAAAEEKAKAETPGYWIGISLRAVDPALLAQLKIEGGVIVEDVMPDSPAAKAGLKKHDVIAKAGDTAIKEPSDVLKAVGAAKDTEMSLLVMRDGKEQTIKVTPAKRPEDRVAPVPPLPQVSGSTPDAWERALRTWRERAGGGPVEELDILGPGVMVRFEPKPLPDDVKITVEREGSKLARITVKRGGDSWGATEKEINTLPAEYQEHVRRMLGLPADRVFAFGEETPARIRGTASQMRVREFREDPLSRIEEELKQLRKEVEELRKAKQ